MIKNTIDLLNLSDFYKVSKKVDFAKGRYSIPTTWKAALNIIKRMLWQRKLK